MILAKAVEASGGDVKARERLEDLQLMRMKNSLAVAEQRAASLKSEQAIELAREMRAELNRRELEVYAARAQRYPQEYRIHYELGVRLKRDGNFDEALSAFDASSASPSLRGASLVERGECLHQLKRYAEALKHYAQAAENAEGNAEVEKLAHYRAGVLATGLRQLDLAEKHLQALHLRDPGYKDLPARLDKLAAIRHKG